MSLIRSDMNGRGVEERRGKNYIQFIGYCPICGGGEKHNCFSLYLDTNRWKCFSDNPKDFDNGTYLEYLKATRGLDDVQAMRELYAATGTEWEPTSKQDAKPTEYVDELPPIVPVQMLNPPPRAPVLIEGVLRQGHKLMLTGASKMGKSWCAMQLAVAVATGGKWLRFECAQGRVLYLNLEIDAASCMNRFHAVGEALGCDMRETERAIDIWNLRGTNANAEAVAKSLLQRKENERLSEYALVILDPLYKLNDGDENAARDMRQFFNFVDELGSELGAAVAIVHHHSKGAKGDMAAGDRGSGSGVLLRDPDAVIDLIEVVPSDDDERELLKPGEFVCRVQAGGIREFPRFETFDAVFSKPLHVVDEEGKFERWKPLTAARKGGKAKAEDAAILNAAKMHHAEAVALKLFMQSSKPEEGILLKDLAEALHADGGPKTTATAKTHLVGSSLLEVPQGRKGKAGRCYLKFSAPPRTLL